MALILVICQKIGQMGLTLATLTKSAFFGGGQCPAREDTGREDYANWQGHSLAKSCRDGSTTLQEAV